MGQAGIEWRESSRNADEQQQSVLVERSSNSDPTVQLLGPRTLQLAQRPVLSHAEQPLGVIERTGLVLLRSR